MKHFLTDHLLRRGAQAATSCRASTCPARRRRSGAGATVRRAWSTCATASASTTAAAPRPSTTTRASSRCAPHAATCTSLNTALSQENLASLRPCSSEVHQVGRKPSGSRRNTKQRSVMCNIRTWKGLLAFWTVPAEAEGREVAAGYKLHIHGSRRCFPVKGKPTREGNCYVD